MEETGYAIITGNGRSGTNWLENILDASPLTHCRSEPYGIPSSPFNKLPQIWQSGAESRDMERQWDEIVAWSRAHIGERDHGFKHRKWYCHAFAQRTNIAMLMAHGKTRRILGLIQPSLTGGEWPLPWWVGNKDRLREAYAIFKIDVDRMMLEWLLERRSQVRTLHIVRHPCGRLNSWLNRFLISRDEAQILADRKARLSRIATAEPAWKARFGGIDDLNLVEAEVWFWRYVNESVYETGVGNPNYLRIVYEELAADPLPSARRVYEFCGLPWSAQVQRILDRELRRADSVSIAHSWKTRLPTEHVRTVERIVSDSPLMSWWSGM
jgi:LPS sulfotransferase NodH